MKYGGTVSIFAGSCATEPSITCGACVHCRVPQFYTPIRYFDEYNFSSMCTKVWIYWKRASKKVVSSLFESTSKCHLHILCIRYSIDVRIQDPECTRTEQPWYSQRLMRSSAAAGPGSWPRWVRCGTRPGTFNLYTQSFIIKLESYLPECVLCALASGAQRRASIKVTQ